MMHQMQSYEMVKEYQERVMRQVKKHNQVNSVKQQNQMVSRFMMRFKTVRSNSTQGQPQAAHSRITAELRALEAGS